MFVHYGHVSHSFCYESRSEAERGVSRLTARSLDGDGDVAGRSLMDDQWPVTCFALPHPLSGGTTIELVWLRPRVTQTAPPVPKVPFSRGGWPLRDGY